MDYLGLYREEKSTCVLCGDDLEKINTPIDTICDYCGQKGKVTHECNSNHFICDKCYNINAFEFITNECMKYTGNDPLQLAVKIMNSPVINMHGVEHHYIVPAVLLTTSYNIQGKRDLLKEKLQIIEDRASRETSHYCTFNAGTCGAAFGTGVYLSVFNDRSLGDEDEWSEANHIIAESLKKVASSPGPRCCKRDTYLSLIASVEFMNDKYALNIQTSEPKCTFSLRNKNCGREECEFYSISNTLV